MSDINRYIIYVWFWGCSTSDTWGYFVNRRWYGATLFFGVP